MISTHVSYVLAQDNQVEDVSWWPRHAQWVRGGSSTAIWSVWNEHWFQGQLEKIRKGDVKMRNGTDWQKALEMFSNAKKLKHALSKASEHMLYTLST